MKTFFLKLYNKIIFGLCCVGFAIVFLLQIGLEYIHIRCFDDCFFHACDWLFDTAYDHEPFLDD